MKIYLDNCCYNRPFDDQTQERVHLESEAVLTVLKKGQMAEYEIVGSNIVEYEMERMKDEDKKQKVKELYRVANEKILYSQEIKMRANEIARQSRIRTLDSIHIAIAEKAGADVLLTTDDALEKMASRLDLAVKVLNPLKFIWEVILDGES